MAVSLTDDFPPGGEAVILGTRQREVEEVLEDKGGGFEERSKLSQLAHTEVAVQLWVAARKIATCRSLWRVFEADVMTCAPFTIHNHHPAKHSYRAPFLLSKSIRLLLRGGHLAQTLNHSYVNLLTIYEAQCHTDSLLILEGSLRWITVTT